MIWIISFFLFPFFCVKEAYFLSATLDLSSVNLFILSIFSPVGYLIFYFKSPKMNLLEENFYLSFYFLILLFLSICFCSCEPFLFLMSLETCAFFMLMLILNFSKDSDKIYSCILMFLLNILGSIPFMYFSTFNFFINLSNFVCSSLYMFYSNVIFFCFLIILLLKLPVFLGHFWLTKAHVSASGSSSMILASLMLKIGSMGLYKFSHFFSKVFGIFSSALLSLCIWSCIFMSVIMLRYFDLKYMVACSSILHMSMTFPLTSSGSPLGLISSFCMVLGHGIVSYFLFFLVSVLYESNLNRSFDFNKFLESSNKSFSMFFFFFFLMNLGFPPFINFFSEVYSISFLLFFSLIFTLLFSVSLQLSLFFFVFTVLKMLFGKKNMLLIGSASNSLPLNSLIFSFFFFFLLFLF